MEGATAVRAPLSAEQAERLLAYLDAVLDENTRVNLTGIRDRADAVVRHLIDSLSLVGVWRAVAGEGPPRRVLDVGTGGGFPGAPLAVVWPETPCLLIDSTGKKVRAVERTLGAAEIPNARALQVRGEQLAGLYPRRRRSFDLVVARAVGRTARLLGECRELVAPGGRLLVMKGPEPPADELDEAAEAAPGAGLVLDSVQETAVPGLDRRKVLVYTRS